MEACVVSPVLTALLTLVGPADPRVVMVILLGALLAIHYVARLVMQISTHYLLRSSLLVLGMLASALVVLHRLLHTNVGFWNSIWLRDVFQALQRDDVSLDIVFFLVVAFLWWRGFVLARRRLESGTIVTSFRVGVEFLAITTVIGGLVLPAPPYQFVFAYFFVSLLGIALARAEEVSTQYGGGYSPFNAGWLALVVVAALGVLLISAGVASVLTGENVSRFIDPMMSAQRFLFNILVYLLLIGFSWLGRLVYQVLERYFDRLEFLNLERMMSPFRPGEGPGPEEAAILTVEQAAVAKGIGVAVGLIAVLLVLALWLRRTRWWERQTRGDERESVWGEVNLRHSIRDLWADGRRRLNEVATALTSSVLGQFLVARTIRRIYAHLMALAAELGHPRADCETPYEYQPTLAEVFPEHGDAVARITRAYVAVHYGEVVERPEELEAIRAAWKQLRETAEAALKAE